jgi:putative SOS response-associated peptidase YedK
MCGRYRLSRRKQIIAEHFEVLSDDDDWTPLYNSAPAQQVPVIRHRRVEMLVPLAASTHRYSVSTHVNQVHKRR